MKRDDMIEMIKKDAKFFKQFNEMVHIKLFDGYFYNGYILAIYDDYLEFQDRKVTKPFKIIFDKIKKIEEFVEDGK